MSTGHRVLKTVGVTAGVVGGVAASAYGIEQGALRALRRRPDPDAGTLQGLEFDEALRIPTADGASLYVVSRGRGVPVLFSHGVTISSQVWAKQFRDLPDVGLRVVAFDHRGHGSSTVGSSGHSLANLADDMRAVLEHLDLHDAIIVGHSMGGVAAQAFAINYPDLLAARVRGLVLLSTLAKTHVAASPRLQRLGDQVTRRLQLPRLMDRRNVGTLLARLSFGWAPRASWVELVRQMLADCDPATVGDATAVLLGLDLTADLTHLDVPTLVIGGTADLVTPPAEARRIASAIPNARLVLLRGAGHTIMLERTDEFHALLLGFAQELGLLPATAGAA